MNKQNSDFTQREVLTLAATSLVGCTSARNKMPVAGLRRFRFVGKSAIVTGGTSGTQSELI